MGAIVVFWAPPHIPASAFSLVKSFIVLPPVVGLVVADDPSDIDHKSSKLLLGLVAEGAAGVELARIGGEVGATAVARIGGDIGLLPEPKSDVWF